MCSGPGIPSVLLLKLNWLDKASERTVFNGWCAVIIQSVKNGGILTLEASVEGLRNYELSLQLT